MIISLYTSRVVLQVLGVEDYGIYAVTGGFVMAFSFINNAMAGATSRFITYEIGKCDKKRTRDTFTMAFYEHLIIALIILVLAETVGLWFVNNKLVIPETRMFAANWVYQMSIFSMLIRITQTPYMACVMAYERMDIYAYVELLNVFLKLGVVFLLMAVDADKLILYSSLVLGVYLLIATIYRVYCIRKFEESHLQLICKKDILRPMLTFSGWDFYGHLSDMSRNQGVVIVQNMFFGPVVNAASNIATTVQSVIVGFASNVNMSIRPQIVKYFAAGECQEMVHLVHNAIRINALILMLVTIPLLCELDFVLHIWLGEVPNYTVIFCSFMLIYNLLGNMSSVLTMGIQATGNLKRQTLINATLYILVVPFSYFAFKYGNEPWLSYFFNVLAVCLGIINCAFTFRGLVNEFKMRIFVFKDVLPILAVFCLSYACSFVTKLLMTEGWFRLFVTVPSTIIVCSVTGYFLLLPISVRNLVVNKIRGYAKLK